MLSCTPGMVKLEEKWSGRALMGTVGGSRPPVSPFDLFVRFSLSEDCTRVLHMPPRPRRQRRDARDEPLASWARRAGIRAAIPNEAEVLEVPTGDVVAPSRQPVHQQARWAACGNAHARGPLVP